jgi:hypothetical protein
MQEAFIEWIRDKLGPPSISVVILISFACVLIILISYLVGASTNNSWASGGFWLGFLSEIAKITLASIVTGAVLKALFIGGFFEQAVAAIIFEERGLEILSSDRHIEIWKSLTARIYAPSFRTKAHGDAAIGGLYAKISALSAKQIEYAEQFYIRRLSREITLEWVVDEGAEIARALDYMSAELVPFDPKKEIVWRSKVTSGSDGRVSDYYVNDVSLEIEGETAARREKRASDDTMEFTHYLSGRDRYQIRRTRETFWKLNDDPVFTIKSPYIIEEGTFKVNNSFDNRRVVIQNIGHGELFRFSAPPEEIIRIGNEVRREIATVLLPNQGIQLIVVL